MHGLPTVSPSRFSAPNPNGLWDYSPFLCEIDLMEGLEVTYRLGMALWNRMHEPVLMIHLHNLDYNGAYTVCATLLLTQRKHPSAFPKLNGNRLVISKIFTI